MRTLGHLFPLLIIAVSLSAGCAEGFDLTPSDGQPILTPESGTNGNQGGSGGGSGTGGSGTAGTGGANPNGGIPPGTECTPTLACLDTSRACCSNRCIAIQSDRDHCGACGQACESWEGCEAGSCVPLICDDVAPPAGLDPDAGVSTADPDENFNGCPGGELCHEGDVCRCGAGLSCGESGECVDDVCLCGGGEACRSGQSCCEEGCISLLTDMANCGACGEVCAEPADACENGQCVCESTGFPPCDGECLDLNTNQEHCGACGNVCAEGSTCCGGTCVDTANDKEHCGACGNECESTRANHCVDSVCMCGTSAACSGDIFNDCNQGLFGSNWGCGFHL